MAEYEIDSITGERRAKRSEDKQQQKPLAPAITDEQLALLYDMTKYELIALLKLCNENKLGYALLGKDEKRERLKLKIYTLAMESANDTVTLKAANDWLDREDGKAIQQIKQDVNVSGSIALIGAEEVQSIIDGWLNRSGSVMIENTLSVEN